MNNSLMEKMLDLPEFKTTDLKQNDNDMGFYVEMKERPDVCPACGCYMPKAGYIQEPEADSAGYKSFGKAYSPHYQPTILRMPGVWGTHWNSKAVKDYGAAFEDIFER